MEATKGEIAEPSAAEFYLELGRCVRLLLRRGYSPNTIALAFGYPSSECQFALQYVQIPDWLKLRALVEDWSWEQIKETIQEVEVTGSLACEPHVHFGHYKCTSREACHSHQLRGSKV